MRYIIVAEIEPEVDDRLEQGPPAVMGLLAAVMERFQPEVTLHCRSARTVLWVMDANEEGELAELTDAIATAFHASPEVYPMAGGQVLPVLSMVVEQEGGGVVRAA